MKKCNRFQRVVLSEDPDKPPPLSLSRLLLKINATAEKN